jgi:hypothetical protein
MVRRWRRYYHRIERDRPWRKQFKPTRFRFGRPWRYSSRLMRRASWRKQFRRTLHALFSR